MKIFYRRCFFIKNIIVLFGGKSCEHDVSIITGVMVLNCLSKEKYNVVPVYISKDNELYTDILLFDIEKYKDLDLKKLKKAALLSGEKTLYFRKKNKLKKYLEIDYAINCCHGGAGESGALCGMLETSGIPISSPPLFGASSAMDKCFTKIICKGLSVKTLPYFEIVKREYIKKPAEILKAAIKKLAFPIIVKPANLGSSIGISKANDFLSLQNAVNEAFNYDNKLLLEPALEEFTELCCAAYKLNDEIIVSECEKQISSGDILSFGDKYESGSKDRKNRIFPFTENEEAVQEIKSATKKLYSKLDLNGIVRADYLIKDNQVYFNELNTIPGSLAYYLFCNSFGEFEDLLDKIIKDGLITHSEKDNLRSDFSSNILKIKGCK